MNILLTALIGYGAVMVMTSFAIMVLRFTLVLMDFLDKFNGAI